MRPGLREGLHIWTVTHRPKDLPGVNYAARLHVIDGTGGTIATDALLTDNTLDGLRAQLPPGLYRIPRSPCDDPVIVESWL